MTELLTAAQMRAIEREAMSCGAVTGLELMERAGRAVVEAVLEEWPELGQVVQVGEAAQGGAAPPASGGPAAAPPEYLVPGEGVGRSWCRRAVVLCGPGNNGGDGFVVARLLQERGWQVEVFLLGDHDRLPPDARRNHDRWQEVGRVAPLTLDALSEGGAVDLCVDALFGTGLSRPVAPGVVAALRAFADAFLGAARVVSVDICSGMCADSGRGLGLGGAGLPGVLRPDLTVTFHRAKLGHYLGDGPEFSGKLVVADIGLDRAMRAPGNPGHGGSACDRVQLVDPPSAALTRNGGHKYAHGHALVLAGPAHRTGAARLAARGALRVGAGLVTLAAPGSALQECACQLTAVMLRRCDDAPALSMLLEDRRLNALCLGPGLGTRRAEALVDAALAAARATVLDADALTAFEHDPAALFSRLHEGCVLTPHGGEFARLFPDLAARLTAPAERGPAWSRVDAARAAAERAGCVVLLKGPDTVIAAPDGRCAVNAAVRDRATPWLATAGAGDVLAGFIAGLMARGLPAWDAACAGAWLHVESALEFGPGLIAEDLPEVLPAVFRHFAGREN